MPTPRAKARTKAAILQLHISLPDIIPPIWRSVQVPGSMSLGTLHLVIQESFGWQNYHLYRFELGARHFEAPDPEAEGADASRTKLKDLLLAPGDQLEYV